MTVFLFAYFTNIYAQYTNGNILGTIHEQEKTTVKEQKLYQKLKALNHYRRYFGEEAILHKKALERRAQVSFISQLTYQF